MSRTADLRAAAETKTERQSGGKAGQRQIKSGGEEEEGEERESPCTKKDSRLIFIFGPFFVTRLESLLPLCGVILVLHLQMHTRSSAEAGLMSPSAAAASAPFN